MSDAGSGPDRVLRTYRLIEAEPVPADGPAGMIGRLSQLCGAAARHLPATGVGLSLLTEDHSGGGTAAASDRVSRQLEELQFSVGEGPCIDAFASRRPVLEPDLAGRGMSRWPAYTPAAHDHGVRAVFAFPLQVGAARLGALDIYRDRPGSLSPAAVSQAVTFAEIAMATLLDGQAAAPVGEAADGLDDVLAYRLEVYQAQGMVMADLGVGLTEALARLRAHAYASDRPLSDVARDVVAGKISLQRDPPSGTADERRPPPADRN